MTLRILLIVVVCVALGMVVLKARQVMGQNVVKPPTTAPAPAEAKSPLAFVVKDIQGKEYDLAQLKGKVVLIVNVASKCGLTPQYKGLEALYDQYKERGFVVIGFPANNFNGQEPGTDEEIKTFCSTKYDVSFPMMSKISVKGDDQHALYQLLTKQTPEDFRGEIGWNFTKFLVDRNGQVFARFGSKTKPEDAAITAAIEKGLEAK